MSWYNSIGDLLGDVKSGVTNVGHAAGSIAGNPWVDGAIGAFFGPGAAAVAGGLGHLIAPGGNLGTAAKGALTGGAAGLAGQQLGKVVRGSGGIVDKVLGAGKVAAGGAIPAAVGGTTGGGGILDTAKSFLTGNGGTNALAVAQAANAAMLGKKSSDLADSALDSVKSNWDSRQGLRDAGSAGMLAPGAGIASRIAALPNHNVYSQPRVAPTGGASMPASVAPSVRPAGAYP